MSPETIFHLFFTFYFLAFAVLRSYYTGYVDAAGEEVTREEEGTVICTIRYGLGSVVVVGALLYLLHPPWMVWSQWAGMPLWIRWSGVLIMAAGVYLYGWTHQYLGKNFTDTVYVRKDAKMVTDGPYRYIRHPMYTSAILAAIGAFFLSANWIIGGLGLFIMLVVVIWRTPIEENKLIERYGDAYLSYKKRTASLFPFLF